MVCGGAWRLLAAVLVLCDGCLAVGDLADEGPDGAAQADAGAPRDARARADVIANGARDAARDHGVDGSGVLDATRPVDGTVDARREASLDGGSDAPTDARPDGNDSGRDATVDARHDAAGDGGRDGTLDARHDGGHDSGHDATTDARHDGGTDGGHDAAKDAPFDVNGTHQRDGGCVDGGAGCKDGGKDAADAGSPVDAGADHAADGPVDAGIDGPLPEAAVADATRDDGAPSDAQIADGGCGDGQAACEDACVNLMTDNENCGACGDGCCGAHGQDNCSSGICQPEIIAASVAYGSGLAVDTTHVYWTTIATDGGGAVYRAQLSSGVEVLGCGRPDASASLVASAQGGPVAIAVSEAGVFWTDQTAGVVMSAPLGPIEGVSDASSTPIASGLAAPTGIAADRTHVYWAERGDAGHIESMKLADGSVPVALADAAVLHAFGVALCDATLGFTGASEIGSVRTNGKKLVKLSLGPSGTGAMYQVATDGVNVYWTEGNAVRAMPVGSSTPTWKISGDGGAAGIATDGVHVYWADTAAGLILRAAVDGGSVLTLATGESSPTTVAIDAHRVYWVNSGPDGSIHAVSK